MRLSLDFKEALGEVGITLTSSDNGNWLLHVNIDEKINDHKKVHH